MTFLATQRVDERFQAETTSVEGLYRILSKPLLLRSIAELPLLVVGEEGKIIVVLRVSLRHLLVP